MSEKRCKHENADHHRHMVNDSTVVEWLQCLDCEQAISVNPKSKKHRVRKRTP